MNYLSKFNRWINYFNLNMELKKELVEIKDNLTLIEERFYKNLEFGTGGLRGINGAGTNRINIYTVRKATQGLANYIKSTNEGNIVVIAYDSRHKSKEFAEQAALVLAKNNIKAYVFSSITPTPILSYAVRELYAVAGIVITASHNPKEYNGYKVYWSDGGQITDNTANAIIEEINGIVDELLVEFLKRDEAEEKNLLCWLDDGILDSYIKKTKKLVLNQEIINQLTDGFKIVYTPLHGTGNIPVTRLLKEVGFKNVLVVPEQANPDPDFSTVMQPNPEEKESFCLAINLADEINADVVLGTDPDADRLGVAVKDYVGIYRSLTGSQLGALMIDYILQMRERNHTIPINGVVVKTIVTSNMGVNIAKKYGVDYIDVLTGFKYIGEKINEFYQKNNHTFLFGYEESYGFLIGDYVRDKDAVQSCLLVAEMVAYYKVRDISLLERLNQLYEEFGYYREDLVSITLEGIEGKKRIKAILDRLRTDSPKIVDGKKVIVITDYWNEFIYDVVSGLNVSTNLPKTNVLLYTLEDDSWFCIRPSGTEPKLKIYFSVVAETMNDADENLNCLKSDVLNQLGITSRIYK